jgi:ubiquinone/menaquinone biosynthesis C-methylase UbiE
MFKLRTRPSPPAPETKAARRRLRGAIESKMPAKRPFTEYRRFIQEHYDGFPGKLTTVTGFLTGHEVLAGKLISAHGFDVRGAKRILDAACGNGRYSRFLLREADHDAFITSFDYSQQMLHRARNRLKNSRVTQIQADITRLPYADQTFDSIVCGWVLEHLPDPKPGLRELARVLKPGGRMLLMVTEDTFLGAWCSRLWHCRTYNRAALRLVCEECGLGQSRELWFSRLHASLRMGGIIIELRRLDVS